MNRTAVNQLRATKLRAALIQQAWVGNRKEMVAATCRTIRTAASQGAQLVLCQELHTSAYFCQQELVERHDLAETIPGPSTTLFGALAQELGIVLVISLFERRAPGLSHNTAVVIERDGSIAGTYRKMHIPDDPGFHEKFYFAPGDQGFEPIVTSVGKLGVLICWDQWYPEAARLMALAGADLLLYPTAIGWSQGDDAEERARQREAWITVQRSHAITNGLPVLAVNRCGSEQDCQFWGSSFAAGPQGELLAQAAIGEESVLLVDLDLERSENVRRWWPFLRDRRIDAYGGLLKRWRD
ncbi:carbon-nitrogen hydrolase [Cyanobium sp. HWJ4-Hawea]|uniref:carbon-nitrogen hydrolase n=1 Tax=Cyanobium sp. HWJ4-Hawea TaxID=2823713 RepID=UPI0028F3F1CD|nr:carbon-nitrogen hydrolase [Cyanobium sp. HWJ4-Hawea]